MAKDSDSFTQYAYKLRAISDYYLRDENILISSFLKQPIYDKASQNSIKDDSRKIITQLKNSDNTFSVIDKLLQEYGLSSKEGVLLMRLSEALVRTKDRKTAQILIADKLSQGDWASHAGNSSSFLVNRATQALQFSAFWMSLGHGKLGRYGATKLENIILYKSMKLAMRMMGSHFVLGQNIDTALSKSKKFDPNITCFSYDMLGEAAFTADDALRYYKAYENAVLSVANSGPYENIRHAPSISIKLSALHPRYESNQAEHCITPISERLIKLCLLAKAGNFGITIDAEECERLEISLIIAEKLCAYEALQGWDGLSIVVQAYQKRALPTIEYIADMGRKYDRKLMIRLVKGAYWDSEIKRAQEMGLSDYPVFTRKENSDLSYLICAKKIIDNADIIYPQFATHNAQSAAAVAYIANQKNIEFEFQRLYGMGDELHDILARKYGVKSRVYAPVGPHKDLLPYLVRRLLENGANSSFVNQLSDENIDSDRLIVDPLDSVRNNANHRNPNIPMPCEHLGNGRISAPGFDDTQFNQISKVKNNLEKAPNITAFSVINGETITGKIVNKYCPFDNAIAIGQAHYADIEHVKQAIESTALSKYQFEHTPKARANMLREIGDGLLAAEDELIALLVWEAGKTVNDALSEIREAVDFCRYYADQAELHSNRKPLGIVACISPWNFPLAIYLGQIVAALSMGNVVIAKPAEQTPLIAYKVNDILFASGVPKDAFHLLIGDGATLGNALTSSNQIDAICFTGSTKTAKHIARNLADIGRADIPFIAETGGINAMIIDSTALLEQVIEDVIASAFQSAGQRCSACRLLCIQEDIADECITMLRGAMAALQIGNPTSLATDIGPVIDKDAQKMIDDYSASMQKTARNVGGMPIGEDMENGSFSLPYAFEIENISDLKREIFGPILHVKRYKGSEIDGLINDINDLGYGLTMGLHTRIDGRVQHFSEQAHVGNLYVNRNQIGAVVGVQPFGGEGLSGTGPKAGGPHYLKRLSQKNRNDKVIKSGKYLTKAEERFFSNYLGAVHINHKELLHAIEQFYLQRQDYDIAEIYSEILINSNSKLDNSHIMPGPTGETNILSMHPRGIILCMGGDTLLELHKQIAKALILGNGVTIVRESDNEEVWLFGSLIDFIGFRQLTFSEFEGVAYDGQNRQSVAEQLAKMDGPIRPILSAYDDSERYGLERCVTIDTTAAGGNASLLALN